MKGNCKHEVGWSKTTDEVKWHNGVPTRTSLDRPHVAIANNEDPNYWQMFETVDELDAFIRELVDARELAFSPVARWTLEEVDRITLPAGFLDWDCEQE